jgi:hypothetical protein
MKLQKAKMFYGVKIYGVFESVLIHFSPAFSHFQKWALNPNLPPRIDFEAGGRNTKEKINKEVKTLH